MKKRTTTVPAAIAIALLACPVTALALDAPAAEQQEVVIDRSDFYEPLEEDGTDVSLLATTLVQISDEMKYFTKYESHGDYDLGFSSGDGYNAVGYYQFDRRYSLISFMRYCVSYDADKYSMFDAVIKRADEVSDGDVPMYEDGALTELGQLVEDAWHAAYAADPEEFSLLQDNYSYNSYYAVTERYLSKTLGISMTGRADCVKGLVWSMTNLFGTGGVQYFLGVADLSNSMTDREMVNALCDAVVDNVAARYPSQPQYHQGWINRYENERADCLAMLPRFSDVTEGSWYYDTVLWAADHGIMGGYTGTDLFGAEDSITRGQVACVLYNMAGSQADDTDLTYEEGTGYVTGFDDVDGTLYYAKAIAWAAQAGVVGGDTGTSNFRPDDAVSRQELAAMLANYARVVDRADVSVADADAALAGMSDAEGVSAWAKGVVAWAVQNGIMGNAGYVAATDDITRAETAAMVYNYSVL